MIYVSNVFLLLQSFEEQEKAKSLGAVYAGDQALIKEVTFENLYQ